jgi:hypothetical protein
VSEGMSEGSCEEAKWERRTLPHGVGTRIRVAGKMASDGKLRRPQSE